MKNRDHVSQTHPEINAFLFFGCSLLSLAIGLAASFRNAWDFLCLFALIGFIFFGIFTLLLEKKFLYVLPTLSHFRIWFLSFVIFLFLPLLQTAFLAGSFFGFFRTDAPLFIFGIVSLLFFVAELVVFLFSGLCHPVPIQKRSFKVLLFSRKLSKIFISSSVFFVISLLGISGSAILSPEGRLNGLAIEVSQKANLSSFGYAKASVTGFSDKANCSELVDTFAASTYLTTPLYGISNIQKNKCQILVTVGSFQLDSALLSCKTFSTYQGKKGYVNDSSSLKFVGLNTPVSSTDIVPICLSSKSGVFFRDSLGLSNADELIGKNGLLSFTETSGLARQIQIQIVNLCDGSTETESFYSSCYGNFGIVPRSFFETISVDCMAADFPVPSSQAYARDVCRFLVSKIGSQYSRLDFSCENNGVFASDEKASNELIWLCRNRELKNGFGIASLVVLFSFEGFVFVFLFSCKDRDYELTLGDSLLFLGVSIGSTAVYFLILYLLRLAGAFSFMSSTLLLPVLVLTALVSCLLPCFASLPWTAKGK